MAFSDDVSPLPDNPDCKRCFNKPCNNLFIGQPNPGKVIFVHHSEIQFTPYVSAAMLASLNHSNANTAAITDDLKPAELETVDEQSDTDAATEDKPAIMITNPRWEPTGEDAPRKYTFIDDTIRLCADVKNYPDGAPVTFDIFDVTEKPPLRIGSARGKNKNGTGIAEWKVDDPNKHGNELKLEFDGRIRNKKTSRAPLEVKVVETGGIHLLFEDQDGALLKGIEVTISASGQEIYSETADTGEVGITEIPFSELLAECTYKGTTIRKDLHWNGGKPPYNQEVIVISTSTDTGEAA